MKEPPRPATANAGHPRKMAISLGDILREGSKTRFYCNNYTNRSKRAEFRGEPVEVRPRENLTDARPGRETIVEILQRGRQRMLPGTK
jgi:hypothetical protein